MPVTGMQPATAPYGQQERSAYGASPYNPFIWWIVAIYALIAVLTVPLFAMLANPATLLATSSSLDVIQLAFAGVGLIGWIAAVLLAVQDGKELESRGIVRPFHWAFTCIPSYGPTIYIIGRSIVARRRTGSGLAPIWVHVGVTAASYAIGIAMIVSLFVSLGSGTSFS